MAKYPAPLDDMYCKLCRSSILLVRDLVAAIAGAESRILAFLSLGIYTHPFATALLFTRMQAGRSLKSIQWYCFRTAPEFLLQFSPSFIDTFARNFPPSSISIGNSCHYTCKSLAHCS